VAQDEADRYIGKPMDITLPQYAYHLDEETGEKTACVVVQAEDVRGRRLVGAYLLPERTLLAGLYGEFELLGTQPPVIDATNGP
jgi:hypothetical protein